MSSRGLSGRVEPRGSNGAKGALIGMTKKCKKCKVPLEGFLYRLIAKALFGVRPSTKDPELCNKCEDKK